MKTQAHPRMLVVELNEAERYYLELFVAEKKLPTFEKLLQGGKLFKTPMRSWDPTQKRAWRNLSPWIVWPSIYTGMEPSKHHIIGFGQRTRSIEGRYVWDHLNQHGITTGVFGNQTSYTVHRNPYSLFSVPEWVNENEPFFVWAKTIFKRMPVAIACKVLAKFFVDLIKTLFYPTNRILLQASLQMQAFPLLYKQFKPQFATIHLNHMAYMEHQYWRSGDLDEILKSFQLADVFLSKVLSIVEDDTVLVVMTGLGKKRMDVIQEVHSPVIRFFNIEKLLGLVEIERGACEILTYTNPDITLNFPNASEASLGAYKLSNLKVLGSEALFHIKQVKNQLFLEGRISANVGFMGSEAWLENTATEKTVPLLDYIQVNRGKESEATHRLDNGWILFYGKDDFYGFLPPSSDKLDVTEICALLLRYFDVNPDVRKSTTSDGGVK